ncbi:MAG: hypothetical protein KBF17_04855 [Candidatus Promineofilum sp.]|nr:hypothetical protein [Promineifilum sp.]MBP9656236.1 hypothetical protein [Promineifilum sp.]
MFSASEQTLRLIDDPSAPAYYAVPIDVTHPFRQKEVVREVNSRLNGSKIINSHHILCIRRVYDIETNPTFCYKQNYATPRYSQAFVDWILLNYGEDNGFFESAKATLDARTAS